MCNMFLAILTGELLVVYVFRVHPAEKCFFRIPLLIASTTWPGGFYVYGLLKPKTGCPREWQENGWEENGWIYQDTLNNNPSNNRSEILHIDGRVGSSSVSRHFCIKTATYSASSTTWPKGISTTQL
jgi:hypothetical protein